MSKFTIVGEEDAFMQSKVNKSMKSKRVPFFEVLTLFITSDMPLEVLLGWSKKYLPDKQILFATHGKINA